ERRARLERSLRLEVPPGATSENYLTLRGEGSVGPRGGPRGDIVALFEIAEHDRFARDGTDLLLELPITFGQAALGSVAEVPTVEEGTARVEIPPGAQNGDVVRVRGEGLPSLNGTRRGDLLVRLAVWVPRRLSAEQERLVRMLRESEDAAPERIDDRERRGFWSRVKEALS
ncbi:MAG: molecular chaperone DnaJ, partial [Gemmatimonadetes bacterium]|nr:molecular chaperone DnaJ [Gemmatimonadota bacterium]